LWSPICASKGDATDSPIDSQLDQHTAAFRGCRSALFMRVTGVSERWLQSSVNQNTTWRLSKSKSPKKKLESWPTDGRNVVFRGQKRCKQWIWLAMDTESRAIVGCILALVHAVGPSDYGNRCRRCIREFSLRLLPPNTRCQCSVCYTDFGQLTRRCYRANGIEQQFGLTAEQVIIELFRIDAGRQGYYLANLKDQRYYYCGSNTILIWSCT
jgi:hypothetical protein